jgi:hypothetical protein
VGDTSELPPGLANLSTTGLLRHEQPATLDRWIDAGVAAKLIAISTDQYRTLSLTALGRGYMSGRTEHLEIAAPGRAPALQSWRRVGGRRRARFSEDW